MMMFVLIVVPIGWKTVLTWMNIFIANLMKWIVLVPFAVQMSLMNVEFVVEMAPWNITIVRVFVCLIWTAMMIAMELQKLIIVEFAVEGLQIILLVKKTAMEFGMVVHIGMNVEVVIVALQTTVFRIAMEFGAVMVKLTIVIFVIIIPIMIAQEIVIMCGVETHR